MTGLDDLGPDRAVRLLRALASDIEATIAVDADPDPGVVAGHLAIVAGIVADLIELVERRD